MGLDIGKYNNNFKNFAINLLPNFYRFEWLKGFISSMIAPLQTLSDDFYAEMYRHNTYLTYTGQHLAMETMLNDTYDADIRRIYITENDIVGHSIDIYKESETDPSPTVIYKQSEINPVSITIYKQSEFPLSLYNFTINIPVTISYDSDRFDALITSYVDNKTYNVVTF